VQNAKPTEDLRWRTEWLVTVQTARNRWQTRLKNPERHRCREREREIIALYMAPIIRKTQALLRGNSSDLVLQLKRETLQQFLTKHGFPDAFSRRELAPPAYSGR
jgi:hypothetical protein